MITDDGVNDRTRDVLLGSNKAMSSNDETPVPTTCDREAARARLAGQIGRLLAHEWLKNRSLGTTESIEELSAKDLHPDAITSAHSSR
jgi:hypothetical protein